MPESTAQLIAAGVIVGVIGTYVIAAVVWIVAWFIQRWWS